MTSAARTYTRRSIASMTPTSAGALGISAMGNPVSDRATRGYERDCGGSATAARRTGAGGRGLIALLGSTRRRVWRVRPLWGGVDVDVEPGHEPVAQVLGGKLTQWLLGN